MSESKILEAHKAEPAARPQRRMPAPAAVQFEPLIIPLAGVPADERPSPSRPGPLAALLHVPEGGTDRLLIYIPGAMVGAPLTGRHDYRPLAEALDGIGCATLLLQMTSAQRTIFTKFDTCLNDITSAVEWAKAEGFASICLTGLSMGGPRVAYWTAEAHDPAVKSLIFLATIESSYLASDRNWTDEQRARQDAILADCRALIRDGQGGKVITGELLGGPQIFTAEAYLSFFGTLDDMNASTVKWADQIEIPIAVIHSNRDFAAPPEGAQSIHDSMVRAPRRSITWIENGDHQLLTTGKMADDTCAAITAWVAETLGE